MTPSKAPKSHESTSMTQQQPKPPINTGQRGLELRTIDDMYRFAQYVHASGLAPKGIDTPQAIVVTLQYGAEVGLSPMQSIQNIAVINGRPTLWGDAMLALVRSSGLFDEESFDEGLTETKDGTVAHCTVRRLPAGKPVVGVFSRAQAEKAGLWKKPGPWQSYPERMLKMRARNYALRDAFTDVLRGLQIRETVDDEPLAPPTERTSSDAPAGLSGIVEAITREAEEKGDSLPAASDGALFDKGHERAD